ncbi:unnamed protein product [Meloidogyne enterolobii]|uniref:Uncharacterized protein n=1 Tax=Meloidogyne enterolobii TaxID=390850 RepID=A0ACB0YF21_MELEN
MSFLKITICVYLYRRDLSALPFFSFYSHFITFFFNQICPCMFAFLHKKKNKFF